ncbi:MAG: TVP38/TMEM64 family protein [Deltaproteobacteria bacterium]|nr:TVP38/TMEM64 family protein [Deltaproteobacteria bacterium]
MPPEEKNRVWLKPVILVAVLAAITVAAYQTDFVRFFLDKARLTKFIDSLGAWGFAGFIFLQVVQVVMAPIPGEATGFLGGFLYGPILGTFLSTIGLTIGSFIAFSLSRAFGRPLTDRFVDKSVMGRFDYLLHHKGVFLVFVLFLIPGFPKDLLCYMLGLGHLTTLEFLAIASAGRLLGTTLLTLSGHYLRDKAYGPLFLMAGIAVVIVILTIVYKERLEAMLRRWHEKHPRK